MDDFGTSFYFDIFHKNHGLLLLVFKCFRLNSAVCLLAVPRFVRVEEWRRKLGYWP